MGDFAKIGVSKALAARWIKLDKSQGEPMVMRAVDSIVDSTRDALAAIEKSGGKPESVDANTLKELKKRKLVETMYILNVSYTHMTVKNLRCWCLQIHVLILLNIYSTVKSFRLAQGPQFVNKLEKLETDLTADMIHKYVVLLDWLTRVFVNSH